MNKSAMQETVMFHDFVHIDLSVQLYRIGLNGCSSFFWEVDLMKNEGVLNTWAFDVEKIYMQMAYNISFIDKTKQIFPAYTLGDMEKLLPDFYVSRTLGQYTLMLDNNYPVEPVTATRLPDAFGKMVEQLLNKRFLNPEEAKRILAKTT